jgi:SpoVK/Ycf46/Vps4 family AAA+-type ATPase
MDDTSELKSDFVHLFRLSVAGQTDDIRLFAAKLVRKYRHIDADLSEEINELLRSFPGWNRGVFRSPPSSSPDTAGLPLDHESRLSLLKSFPYADSTRKPIMGAPLEETLRRLIEERKSAKRLIDKGLHPTRSAIFVGPPGVGKTFSARWVANQLGLPLYVLDLTAVMSSLLGRSGSNLRSALDFAKRTPCVLLLDEIDAVAKRRNDDSDVGELKRLVTIILQEVDEWPSSGLLLAATNHPELIDPALWRRFDHVIQFAMPDTDAVRNAIETYLDADAPAFHHWIETLALASDGASYSDVERSVNRLRRAMALNDHADPASLAKEYIASRALELPHGTRIALAANLALRSSLSQHDISRLTGVSRDTIRTKKKEAAKGAR